jgi:Tripartite tricarboxylate transporter TctB family
MSISSRTLTAAVMLVIFAGMTVMALGFPAQAQLMPLLIGVPGTLMALIQLIKELRAPAEAPPAVEAAIEAREEQGRERKMFLWLALFLVGVVAFGFLWATPVLIFAFLRFSERESWAVAAIGAIGAWLILYVVFVRVLELFLFEGLVPIPF